MKNRATPSFRVLLAAPEAGGTSSAQSTNVLTRLSLQGEGFREELLMLELLRAAFNRSRSRTVPWVQSQSASDVGRSPNTSPARLRPSTFILASRRPLATRTVTTGKGLSMSCQEREVTRTHSPPAPCPLLLLPPAALLQRCSRTYGSREDDMRRLARGPRAPGRKAGVAALWRARDARKDVRIRRS